MPELTRPAPEFFAAGRRLVERVARAAGESAAEELAAEESTTTLEEWLASLASRLPLGQALPIVEHLFGVLPLVEACFGADLEKGGPFRDAVEGRRLASLGLFTPNPDFGWLQAAVEGARSGEGAVVEGEVRLATPVSESSVVLVRLPEEEYRLAWIEHQTPGVSVRGSRGGGPARKHAPCWLKLADVVLDSGFLSESLSPGPAGSYRRHLEAYASFSAFVAALYAKAGIRALRRAARISQHRGVSFHTSQVLTMDLTGIEIEIDLVSSAVRAHIESAAGETSRTSALALAAAASKALAEIVAKTAEWTMVAGLAPEGPFAGDRSEQEIVNAFLGGPLMTQSELARTLGI